MRWRAWPQCTLYAVPDILQLHELPHRQARQHLERGSTVFFSIDPIEFHGPHLSLRNDHLISTGLSRRIAPLLQARMNEDGPMLMASTFVSVLLPLVILIALQRYFVRGLLAGSVKG